MTERPLFGKIRAGLGLAFCMLLSACEPSFPLEDELPLGSVLQASQGGSLDGGMEPLVVTGTTCGKISDFEPLPTPTSDCPDVWGTNTPDVVYSWTVPASDRYKINTEGSNFDTVVALKSASSSAQVLLCKDDGPNGEHQTWLEADLVRGQQMLVVVDTQSQRPDACGTYDLSISGQCRGCDTPPPGGCYQTAGRCVNGACNYSLRPAGSACNDGDACTTGDTCNSSGVCTGTPGGCGTPDLGSRLGSAVAQGSTCGKPNGVNSGCDSNNASDQSYLWTAPFAGTFTFTTAGSTYDTVLQLTNHATGTLIGCNDDASGTAQSAMTVALSAGQRIRITVDGYSTSCGSFTLNIQGGSTTKRGLTWVQGASDSCGQTRVTCESYCDPYQGDTLCTESRPLLCIKKDGLANCGPPSDFYDGWTGGTVALTPFLVRGTDLTSLAAANTICANTFGPGYRMAEHHDGGGGWGWRAKGTISPLATPPSTHPRGATTNRPNRFWVHIMNQPGNCWN